MWSQSHVYLNHFLIYTSLEIALNFIIIPQSNDSNLVTNTILLYLVQLLNSEKMIYQNPSVFVRIIIYNMISTLRYGIQVFSRTFERYNERSLWNYWVMLKYMRNLLPTVSNWDNYEELHFMQDGAPTCDLTINLVVGGLAAKSNGMVSAKSHYYLM